MLAATYSTPASDWTRGIDAALAEWAKITPGNANLRINVSENASPDLLASAGPAGYVGIGNYQGNRMFVPNAAARFQGYAGDEADINIRVNPNQPWSFGALSPNKYSWQGTAGHELGHGFGMAQGPGNITTPWDILSQALPPADLHDPLHPSEKGSLMSPSAYMGRGQQFTNDDVSLFGQIGIPTQGDDTFWLIDQARLDGAGGNDRAIWLNSFDDYNAQLSNIERLEMLGDNALTPSQQSIYKLYRAGMGREPDLAGFDWWNDSNKPLDEIARGFFASPEFAPTAAKAQTPDYVASLYRNILGREPEKAGLDYWNSRTDLDGAGLLANIANAPENAINTVGFSL